MQFSLLCHGTKGYSETGNGAFSVHVFITVYIVSDKPYEWSSPLRLAFLQGTPYTP
jgi:hypothetical protein